jgi:hypothetical protein
VREPWKAFGQNPAVIGGKIEIVHGARRIKIGVRVKQFDEAPALVAQVALDLEIRVEGEGRRLPSSAGGRTFIPRPARTDR